MSTAAQARTILFGDMLACEEMRPVTQELHVLTSIHEMVAG